MITTLRNRKADAYGISAKIPRYQAFLDSGVLLACIYASDGTWIADQGSIPLPAILPSGENGTLLPNGALAWRSAPNEITVWDIKNAQTYTLTGQSAWCSPPAHHDGHLFWIEFPAHEDEPDTNRATLTLRRAGYDLADLHTFAEAVFSGGVQSWDLGPAARVAVSNTGFLFATTWRDNLNHEVAGSAGARFDFGAGTGVAQDGAGLDLAQGFAAADGASVGLFAPENTLRALGSELGGLAVPRWPNVGAWELAGGYDQAFNAALSRAGATALLYGYPPDGDMPVVLEAPTNGNGAEPTLRVLIAAHSIQGFAPTLIFILPAVVPL